MVTPIKTQWPVLTFIQGLVHAGYGDKISGSDKKDKASAKKSWNEVLVVLIDAIYDFCDFCVGMLSSSDTVNDLFTYISNVVSRYTNTEVLVVCIG
jgi:hypothetical protein